MVNLEQKIDALTAQVARMAERQRKHDELMDEMVPILKEMMSVGTEKLAGLEEKGYFTFGRELLHVVDNVVAGYSAEDVALLANSVVGILDTVRAVTQPHIMNVAAEAGGAIENPEDVEPIGMMGVMRKSRDEDVQVGLGVMLEVLRRVGKGVAKVNKREKLRKQLGSRKGTKAQTTARARPVARLAADSESERAMRQAPQSAPTAAPVEAPPVIIDGVAFTDEGFLVDANQWTREIGKAIAATLGVVEMTELHWKLVDAARADFAETGASPNIRRLTKISAINTKDIYGMFPKAPGKCTAKVAGLPKPVGCI